MKLKIFFQGIVGLGIMGVILYSVIKLILPYFLLIDGETANTLLTITIPLIFSIVSIYVGRNIEKSKAVQEKLREQKVPIYDSFISGSLKYILDKDTPEEEKTRELLSFFREATPKMLVWMDDSVLKAWADFRTYSKTVSNADSKGLIYKYEAVVLAIRKDLGHKNKNLDTHEILKCFINDLD